MLDRVIHVLSNVRPLRSCFPVTARTAPPSLDPDGHYARLGLKAAADQAAIVTAYRAKARVLHPDVPATGDAGAFVAVKQAYDVLSDTAQREAYDRKARELAVQVVVVKAAVNAAPAVTPLRQPRFSDLPVMVWAGVAAFLGLGVYEATSHLLASAEAPAMHTDIRPNAAAVAPLSPSDRRSVLYGPAPMRLAGNPNFYVIPSGSAAVLWRLDPRRNILVPVGKLPPFSAMQAIRLIRDKGMLEVLVDHNGNGFVSADHLAPGNAGVAWRAYCGYNAGPAPFDGELLERRGHGGGKLTLSNQGVQPAVVKLRDAAGAVAVSVFLDPGGHVDLDGLAKGTYQPEYAIGELWSRACNVFAAGMRARRLDAPLRLPGSLVVAPDFGTAAGTDITDQAFGKD